MKLWAMCRSTKHIIHSMSAVFAACDACENSGRNVVRTLVHDKLRSSLNSRRGRCDLASTCVHVNPACPSLTLPSSAAVLPQDRRSAYGQEKSCGRRQGVPRNQPFPVKNYGPRHPCDITPHSIALLRVSVVLVDFTFCLRELPLSIETSSS